MCTLEQVKKLRTERGRNVRRKNRRDHKQKGPSSKACNAAEGSSEESEVSSYHGSDDRSEDESDLDLSSVDEDSESQDSVSSTVPAFVSSYHGSDERSEDESDLDFSSVDEDSESQDSASSSLERSSDESGPENFGVDEVTKSQELPPLFQLNPGKEQLFLVLVFEILMRIIMGESWEGNDSRFKKAQTYWEKLINTTKESLVASIKWRDYKEKLKKCEVVKFVPLKPTTERQKCEACSMSYFLTKRVVCDEEPDGPDGEVKQEFEVCRSCADKGHVYHKLHHYKQQLKESCFKKINIVKQMTGTEKPRRIVKKCLNDKRWLDWLFSNFQSTLNAADRWAVDGSKTLAMKKY